MDTAQDRYSKGLLVFAVAVVLAILVLGIVRSIAAFNPGVGLKEIYDTLRPWIGICGCLAAVVLFLGAATISWRSRRSGTDLEGSAAMRAVADLLLACAVCASMMTPMLVLQ